MVRSSALTKVVGVLLLLMAVPAYAHHSVTAIFDQTKEVTVTGTLTKVSWTNPHIYYFVDVKDDSGKVTTWSFEGNPPGLLHRSGMRKDMWKTGEMVTVTAWGPKDGTANLGFGKKIKYLSDGHEITLKVQGE